MKKKIIAITQARTGSTRLPGKVLRTVGNKTLLETHIDRVRGSKLIDGIVLATTTKEADNAIATIGEVLGLQVYRGSETDVVDRYYQAAIQANADIIVRVTSDCPLVDSDLMDEIIKAHFHNGKDFTSNVIFRTFPDGMDVEVFDFSMLKRTWQESVSQPDREHVTHYMWKNSDLMGKDVCTAYNFVSGDGNDHSNIRLTLDYMEDFELFKRLIEELGTERTWQEYVYFLDENPDIKNLNLIKR